MYGLSISCEYWPREQGGEDLQMLAVGSCNNASRVFGEVGEVKV